MNIIVDAVEWVSETFLGGKKIFVITAILLSCFILTCLFIYYPIVKGEPIIVVGKRLLFTINKKFSMCIVQLSEPVDVTSIVIFPDFKQKEMRAISTINRNLKMKTIDILPPPQNTIADDRFENVKIEIFYPMFPQAKIEQVIVDGETLSLKKFFDENLKVQDKKYIDKNYIREFISNFIINFNDTISNWTMTFLLFVCGYLVVEMAGYMMICFGSNKKFENHVTKTSCLASPAENRHIQAAKIVFSQKCYRRDIWFRFFQIFGPAFGFIFTITSLIAGLHPSAQIGRDVSQFFIAIQIAMTSTFIGLFMRIISMWLQMINNKISDRAELFFQKLESLNIEPKPVENA
jgi:hypothetical protein